MLDSLALGGEELDQLWAGAFVFGSEHFAQRRAEGSGSIFLEGLRQLVLPYSRGVRDRRHRFRWGSPTESSGGWGPSRRGMPVVIAVTATTTASYRTHRGREAPNRLGTICTPLAKPPRKHAQCCVDHAAKWSDSALGERALAVRYCRISPGLGGLPQCVLDD